MKRKLLILSVIMLLIIALFSANVYAADISSATITITPSKTEYESGDTIEFTVSVKDLQASSGIVGLGAYVDYDSNLLTLNNVATGLSGWADADISESSNRFATTKNGHSSNNEDIIVIKFTAKVIQDNILKDDNERNFVGHIGGDDFIAITEARKSEFVIK